MEQIVINNITMFNTLTPIFIRYGQRHSPLVGTMKGIVISNITATSNSLMSCSITGIPDQYAENIKLSHIILNCPGGGRKEHTLRTIPEVKNSYPENKIFGANLPAYGFFIRHVRHLTLEDIQFNLDNKDDRHALYLDDCRDITIDKVKTISHLSESAYIRTNNVENLMIRGFSTENALPSFLENSGKSSGNAERRHINVENFQEKSKEPTSHTSHTWKELKEKHHILTSSAINETASVDYYRFTGYENGNPQFAATPFRHFELSLSSIDSSDSSGSNDSIQTALSLQPIPPAKTTGTAYGEKAVITITDPVCVDYKWAGRWTPDFNPPDHEHAARGVKHSPTNPEQNETTSDTMKLKFDGWYRLWDDNIDHEENGERKLGRRIAIRN